MDDISKAVSAMVNLNEAAAVLVVGLDMASGSDWTCYRPWLPGAPEIPVTPEMIEAGRVAYLASSGSDQWSGWLVDAYRVMAALAPVELVSPGELAAVRERDETRVELARAYEIIVDQRAQHERYVAQFVPTYYDIGWDERRPVTQAIVDNMERGILKLSEERDEIRRAKDAEIALLRQALAMKDARIAQLDTRLALTPVAFEDFDDAPEKPEHNPFRDLRRDMRRMGP